MPEEAPKNPNENAPESRYRRFSRITLWVTIFAASGAFLCIGLGIAAGFAGWGRYRGVFSILLSGCMLTLFLGVLAHIVVVVFGAMRLTLRSLLASALTLGFGITCLVSGVSVFIYLGLAAMAGLFLFWAYHFFKASYEQDKRDGII